LKKLYKQERKFAAELARKAGKIVLELYKKGVEVSYKDKREPVTEADLASNRIILAGIAEHFPDDAILSEESRDTKARLESSRVWIIDPLDGTREFVDHVGQFVVMIGLAVDGLPVVGAMYQPTTGRLWHAAVDDGAELVEADGSSRPLTVTQNTVESGIRLVITRSHPFKGADRIRRSLGVVEVLQMGSVGLKVGAIVEGNAELYVHISTKTKEWDACAPHAVLQAAGGLMTDLNGDPIRYNKTDVRNRRGLLATNGLVHENSLAVVRPIAERAGLV
jgi:3'(2'), 5'-bisphosphate nucleotidase